MKMKGQSSGYLICFVSAAVLLALIGAWGCSCTYDRQTRPVAGTCSMDPELDTLQAGMEAFARADYGGALGIFSTLSRQTKNDLIRRRALFGLACIKLAQARDVSEFKQALAAWNRWKSLKPAEIGFEDPVMVSPFVDRMASADAPPRAFQPVEIPEEETTKACRATLDKRQKEIQRIKTKAELQQKEIESLRSRIQKLKDQINSLEKIHLEIQEKKKEVSAQ